MKRKDRDKELLVAFVANEGIRKVRKTRKELLGTAIYDILVV
jgi:hypothetical protein